MNFLGQNARPFGKQVRLALSIHSQNMGAGPPENHQPQACKPRLETVKETRTHLLEWFGA